MTTDKKNTVLKAERLGIGYKNGKHISEIASDISFAISRGELNAIVGANGIGKSTLLRTLAGIQPSLSGTIILNDKPLPRYTNTELAREISLVLTDQLPSRNLTVTETIALGRQPYTNWIGTLTENDLHKVKEAINLLNLGEIQHKKCYTLSDGQLQKVMIARAIAQDTSIVILDEPTTHLDVYHKTYILKLLKDLARQTQKSILYSSHEIELSIQLCHKILVMSSKGTYFGSPCQLIEEGSFNHLFPGDLITFDRNTGTFKVK
ncbi:ABC transporter ATP-binding protein [Sinomicrobium weinanense]|uniref:ABC transporter ATP-binding protein n=1 Tax=Sinomicrobium weinanense TaxID=2842200 RepID=A0A926JSH9_9FLAO|nr:ABC transporter ATP-binding protein [Sinomicrobium weinanense]MBC9796700.1 ABC transporter ATP-binding protein [Sinomicrobium weinanense]MBU3123025.1 ABC transporter ATP-binding protein [Sinomicrobium weinanense]